MAAKAKNDGGGKPKANKTYDGTRLKKKETAAKTNSNEGGKLTVPELSNSIIDNKKNQIKSYFVTRNINDLYPTAAEYIWVLGIRKN